MGLPGRRQGSGRGRGTIKWIRPKHRTPGRQQSVSRQKRGKEKGRTVQSFGR